MRRASAGILVTLFVGACGSAPPVTFEPGVERVPGPGYLHIEGDPIVADRTRTVRFVGSDMAESGVSARFGPGDRIVVDGVALAGEHGLSVDGVSCVGRFPVAVDQEIDLVLHLTADACTVSTVGAHAPGAASHEPGRLPE
jgi:hypothetical protein